MNFMEILPEDMVNAPGIHTAIWVSGCPHHCPGCFNQEAWSYDAGKDFNYEQFNYLMDCIGAPICNGLTILGGEPFAPNNIPELKHIIETCRKMYPEKAIWVYTGYTIQELYTRDESKTNFCLKNIDVLVDGRFVEKLKVPLQYRGSSNQRVIDVKKTLATHEYNNVIWYDGVTDKPEPYSGGPFSKLMRKIRGGK